VTEKPTHTDRLWRF